MRELNPQSVFLDEAIGADTARAARPRRRQHGAPPRNLRAGGARERVAQGRVGGARQRGAAVDLPRDPDALRHAYCRVSHEVFQKLRIYVFTLLLLSKKNCRTMPFTPFLERKMRSIFLRNGKTDGSIALRWRCSLVRRKITYPVQ